MHHHTPIHPTYNQDTKKFELDKEYILFHSVTPGFSSDLMRIRFYVNLLHEYHLCIRFIDKTVQRKHICIAAHLPEQLDLLLIGLMKYKYSLKNSYFPPNYQFMEDMGSQEYVVNHNDVSHHISIYGNILKNKPENSNGMESAFYQFHEALQLWLSQVIDNMVLLHQINKY